MLATIGYVLLGASALIAVVNFYLSFLFAPTRRLLQQEFQVVSGIPIIGTLFLLGALLCLEGSMLVWVIVGVILVVDTGALPWFLAVVASEEWRQRRLRK